MQKRLEPGFFDGVMLGILVLSAFVVWQHGWEFTLVKAGNYLWPSSIYGIAMYTVFLYTFIVFILYEFLLGRNAFQSVMYTLIGYYYLDSLVQVYYTTLMHSSEPPIISVYYLMLNADPIVLFILTFILVRFHGGYFNGLIHNLGLKIDIIFHFNFKRLTFFLVALAPAWYIFFFYIFPRICLPLNYPLAILYLLLVYTLSSRRVDGLFSKKRGLE